MTTQNEERDEEAATTPPPVTGSAEVPHRGELLPWTFGVLALGLWGFGAYELLRWIF